MNETSPFPAATSGIPLVAGPRARRSPPAPCCSRLPLALAQACENPKVLRFSIIPTQESVRELTLYKPVLDILSKNTGKKIEFYMPTSYSSVVEALLGKWVDVAVLGPESYLIAKTQGANDRRLRDLLQEEGRRPGSRPRLQVDPHHQEGLEVHLASSRSRAP